VLRVLHRRSRFDVCSSRASNLVSKILPDDVRTVIRRLSMSGHFSSGIPRNCISPLCTSLFHNPILQDRFRIYLFIQAPLLSAYVPGISFSFSFYFYLFLFFYFILFFFFFFLNHESSPMRFACFRIWEMFYIFR